MFPLETTQSVPLTPWEDGSIRITGSRVPLRSVLYHFQIGSSPEQIASKFRGLHLRDISAVIAYYLDHRDAIDQYLRERDSEADARLQQLETNLEYQREKHGIRERLLARWVAWQKAWQEIFRHKMTREELPSYKIPPLLIDQNLDNDILIELYRENPVLDAAIADHEGLSEVQDPEILAWAADNDRILVTHDHHTMPGHVSDRIAAGKRVAGVIIVMQQSRMPQAIDDLDMIVTCSYEKEWDNLVLYLPL
jgi:uncharacterized protein (DUF433 family)